METKDQCEEFQASDYMTKCGACQDFPRMVTILERNKERGRGEENENNDK